MYFSINTFGHVLKFVFFYGKARERAMEVERWIHFWLASLRFFDYEKNILVRTLQVKRNTTLTTTRRHSFEILCFCARASFVVFLSNDDQIQYQTVFSIFSKIVIQMPLCVYVEYSQTRFDRICDISSRQ